MPGQGTLTIAGRNSSSGDEDVPAIPGAAPGPRVVVAVSDTGTGIPADLLDKVFDPFFTTKPQGKGTGLGLYTALGIVRGHGGFIDVASTVGVGTRFTVFLPACQDNGRRHEPAGSQDPAAGRGELILVVDDEPMIRETAREALVSHGYRVLTAGDGREGLEQYQAHRGAVRAVLLDVMMPVMDGPSTLKSLRGLDPSVRVIATSGLPPQRMEAEGTPGGPDLFLRKPFGNHQLLAAVAQVLGAGEPAPNPSPERMANADPAGH
jgi:CheY-like chemotaxis protein